MHFLLPMNPLHSPNAHGVLARGLRRLRGEIPDQSKAETSEDSSLQSFITCGQRWIKIADDHTEGTQTQRPNRKGRSFL